MTTDQHRMGALGGQVLGRCCHGTGKRAQSTLVVLVCFLGGRLWLCRVRGSPSLSAHREEPPRGGFANSRRPRPVSNGVSLIPAQAAAEGPVLVGSVSRAGMHPGASKGRVVDPQRNKEGSVHFDVLGTPESLVFLLLPDRKFDQLLPVLSIQSKCCVVTLIHS